MRPSDPAASRPADAPRAGSYAERQRASLRALVLDAMLEAIAAGNYATTSMALLAARVGVSRQTLYNEFGSRDGLLAAVAARENEDILGQVAATLEMHHGDLPAGVAASIEVVLNRAANDPLTKALLGGDPELLPLFTTGAEPLLEHSRQVMVAYVRAHYPEWPEEDVEILTDAAVRLAHSHIVLPHDPPERVARRIAQLVARYLSGLHAEGEA